ncbi:hypothetical protein J6590_013125 [Homalodisca vitripennis]|nr:hypothetical protein J6590_013125 [Homalodisca vitripennis]
MGPWYETPFPSGLGQGDSPGCIAIGLELDRRQSERSDLELNCPNKAGVNDADDNNGLLHDAMLIGYYSGDPRWQEQVFV